MIAETADELIAIFRNEVDDVVGSDGDDSDKLWKTAELYTYLNEAIDKTARVTHALQERVLLDVISGEKYVVLPPNVVDVNRVSLQNLGVTLEHLNDNELDDNDLFGGPAHPYGYILDPGSNELQLVPPPNADDVAELRCATTLLHPLEDGDDLPFTAAEDLRLVLLWMKALAYKKQDVETEDLIRAQRFENEFNVRALERHAALQRLRRRPGNVRMQW